MRYPHRLINLSAATPRSSYAVTTARERQMTAAVIARAGVRGVWWFSFGDTDGVRLCGGMWGSQVGLRRLAGDLGILEQGGPATRPPVERIESADEFGAASRKGVSGIGSLHDSHLAQFA